MPEATVTPEPPPDDPRKFPGLPHGIYPPPRPPPRPDGSVSLTFAIISGVLAAIALGIMLVLGNDVSQCQSGLGQLAQGFSNSTAQDCSNVIGLHLIAEFFTITLGIGA
jgi:hypothetical protein